jgi:hypothetical protein
MTKQLNLFVSFVVAAAGCADLSSPDGGEPEHGRSLAPAARAAQDWRSEIVAAPPAQLPAEPCGTDCPADDPDPVEPEIPDSFTTDYCDEVSYLGVEWLEHQTDHFAFQFLPGTQAEAQIDEVAARDEAYFDILARSLGVTSEPSFTVHLSPNRVAATAHRLGRGAFYPAQMRIDVVHTGFAESFEMTQYGHELTHAVSDQLFEGEQRPLRIFDEGFAELLDGSGRDLHQAFAHRLLAHGAPPAVPTDFTSSDILGQDYGRAGSLVQHLVERFGFATFVDIFAGSAGSWSGGCFYDPQLGCIDTVEAIEAAVAGNVEAVTGVAWKTVAADWTEKVGAALVQAARAPIPVDDRAQVTGLLAVMDRAIEEGDADTYRSVMEGFYCDWGGESMRTDIAARMVDSFATSTTTIDAIHPVGTRNYPEMIALATQVTDEGPRSIEIYLEKIGGFGWRISWIDDWR